MRASQFKNGAVMIESGWFPTGYVMACFTDCTLAAIMFIILLVAANTSGGRIFELAGGGMALFTSDFFMLTGQGETSHSMIKMGHLPVLLDMAGLTGGAQFFFMRIIFEMAISAFSGQCFKID